MSVFASRGAKPVESDPNKASEGACITSVDGAAQTWTGATSYDSVVITNCSQCKIRGTFVYEAGVVPNGDGTFLIDPDGVYAVTFQDAAEHADGDTADVITGITFDPVERATSSGVQVASEMTAKELGPDAAFELSLNAVES